jgi:competence protein ComEC
MRKIVDQFFPQLLITAGIITGIFSLFVIYLLINHLPKNNSQELMVSFLDVGQGDAIYIQSPNGNNLLIDAGPYSSIQKTLKKITGSDTHLDAILFTHPDQDHIGGLSSILSQYDTPMIIHPEKTTGTKTYANLMFQINEKKIEHIIARRGERIILDRNRKIYMDILFPDQDTSSFSDTNTASIVSLVTYGSTRFILTGDAPADVETFLTQVSPKEPPPQDITTVLKLGHHGSKTSSSNLFLNTFNPDYAIISSGANNRYGHPHNEVTQRITDMGIPILTTSEMGTITFFSDGNRVRYSTTKKQNPPLGEL